jgi:2-keto-4-pentenoate hydratase/2-oxohepta-3-ene-1,7-dioic acid hydratase in catechol pathway
VRLIRYRFKGETAWGIENDGRVRAFEGDIFGTFEAGSEVAPIAAIERLAPWDGGKVVGFALNYPGIEGARFDTDAEPLVFLKGPNAVVPPNSDVHFRQSVFEEMWIEVELAFMVSRRARDVGVGDAPSHILGYTIGNDVTARNVMGRDHHLARSKSLDTFCPLGPAIETDFDPADVVLTSRINGETVQRGSSAERFYDDARALSMLSTLMTLEPGDLVLTGTPAGAGPGNRTVVRPGDRVELEIAGLGTLVNRIVSR